MNKTEIKRIIAFLNKDFHLTLGINIFEANESNFEQLALAVFKYQYAQVAIYKSYCDLMHRNPTNVSQISDIPFLPISFFKSHCILSDEKKADLIFESSTTTGTIPSKHYIAAPIIYETSYLKTFEQFYDNPEELLILALLPSYLERGHSSLVYMANDLIKRSKHKESCFIMDDFERLNTILQTTSVPRSSTLLIGVTYALLDFAEQFPMNLGDAIIMETGGMKGRRAEMTRQEVQQFLQKQFLVKQIHSEYGMTELLSQAYSKGNGIFKCPSWMKVMTRDVYDPTNLISNQTGGINIIDLANIYSCSFIATSDVGKVADNGQFEVLGRMDATDIRGCNLMYDSTF